MVASRRAVECNIIRYYRQLEANGNEDAADFVSIGYLIYFCELHLTALL